MPVLSRRLLPLMGFPGDRVPALKVDSRKLQGSREVSRELDLLRPEPPIFPADPAQRARVEEVERWADEVLQEIPRRISWWALKRRKSDQTGFLQDARFPIPLPTRLLVATSGPIVRLAIRTNGSTDEVVRVEIASIPAALDRIDALIAEGVLGGEPPNAADFQVATSLRLLEAFEDIAPALSGRPALALAHRVAPATSGHIGPVFPAEWLAPLRAASAPRPTA
jgi:glutathione S-transferase